MKLIVILVSSLLLFSCGDDHSRREVPTEDVIKVLEGVKYITPSISLGTDERSLNQFTHSIDDSGRLLLRFESLESHLEKLSAGGKLFLILTLPNSESREKAIESFSVCPLTKDWMMLATWTHANPYRSKGGRWSTPGGDFQPQECIRALKISGRSEESKSGDSGVVNPNLIAICTDPQKVCFDLSRWLQIYVKEQNVNYGFILSSAANQAIPIFGGGSGANRPRVFWSQPIW